jgi:hypothetical protein
LNSLSLTRRHFLRLSLAAAVAGPLRLRAESPAAPLRVFVCAHSFMIFTARMLPPMARAGGAPYAAAGQQMLGGSTVIQHWNLPDGQNKCKAALQAGAVDVLTLAPNLLQPDPGIDNFTKAGLEHNPKLRVLVQASWPPRDGVLDRSFKPELRNEATAKSLRTLQHMFKTTWVSGLEDQVKKLNKAAGQEAVHIIPVGDAVFALRRRVLEGTAPGIPKQAALFRDALGHPEPALAVLITYCHYAAIFGQSPVGLPVPEEIRNLPQAGELNALMQQIAWETVTGYAMSGVRA